MGRVLETGCKADLRQKPGYSGEIAMNSSLQPKVGSPTYKSGKKDVGTWLSKGKNGAEAIIKNGEGP